MQAVGRMPAVIYTRVSPRPKSKMERNESIELQTERCEAYCKANDYKLLSKHEDRELSGTSIERPGLIGAIAEACTNKAILVVYSLSRLARNTKDAIEIMEQLRESGASIASLHEKLDTSGAMGKFVYVLMAALAELERNQISERTSDAMRYGKTEEEESNIEHIHYLKDMGYSYDQIARFMNREGLKCRGKMWWPKTIWRILRREAKNG